MQNENEKLRGELLEAQAWLAHTREGGGDAPVAPAVPAAGAVAKQYMHHVPLRSKEGAVKAPLSEVDLVAQVQQVASTIPTLGRPGACSATRSSVIFKRGVARTAAPLI